MFGRAGSDRPGTLATMAVGAAAGLAAGAAGYVLLRLRGRRRPGARPGIGGRLEDRVLARLGQDAVLVHRSIEVASLADGIVELSGRVETDDEADRAVEIAQRVPGVRTVLNRLDVGMLESHLEETRRRYADGAPELHETHWYGGRVGTGRRRQGHETDPDRPDDKVSIQSRELGTDRALEQTSEDVDKLAPAVEGHTTGNAAPTDRARVDDASHRRLGNVEEEPIQDVNPASGIHENVNKGTEVTLEEAGLEGELKERGLEERS